MRLDLFLKLSRLCPRRTVAQQLCDAGLVLLNGHPAKSGHVVKPGDVLTVRRRDHELEVRVAAVPATRSVSKNDARSLFEQLSQKIFEPGDL